MSKPSNQQPKKSEGEKPLKKSGEPLTPTNGQKVVGYGETVPQTLLEEKEVEIRYKESAKKVGIIVSKSLIVITLYSHAFASRIFLGDFITHINTEQVTSKNRIYELLESFKKTHETFKIRLKRPKWLIPTTNVPKGYDIAPGYSYYTGLMVLYPNSTVGLNVKAFSSRVYVVRVEGDSIAVNTCLVGDCIVDVDGCPVTTVTDCSEKIVKGLKEKRYVQLTIERASTPMTCRAVRCALFADKQTPMDPKMALDSSKIGEDEASRIKTGRVPVASKGILKAVGSGPTGVSFYGTQKPHMDIKNESVEHTIGCEPYNPLFFHKVKQRKDKNNNNPDMDSSSSGSSGTISGQSIERTSNTTQATTTTTKTSSLEKLDSSLSTANLRKKKSVDTSKINTPADVLVESNRKQKSSYQNVEQNNIGSIRRKKSVYGENPGQLRKAPSKNEGESQRQKKYLVKRGSAVKNKPNKLAKK